MKVGIYTNTSKDIDNISTEKLFYELDANGINYVEIASDSNIYDIDLLIVLGGDGTILKLVDYIVNANVPVLGINAGKVGFLSEFEIFEIEDAVQLIKNKELIVDERLVLQTNIDNKVYYALNEIVLQRIYNDTNEKIIRVDVSINGEHVDRIDGDGVIISTPTGSTAYSLSAGGSILTPTINAFSMTPLCAHSLHNRPLVFPADNPCEITLKNNCPCGLFIDGILKKMLTYESSIKTFCSDKKIRFLRKKDSNFYTRLLKKLKK